MLGAVDSQLSAVIEGIRQPKKCYYYMNFFSIIVTSFVLIFFIMVVLSSRFKFVGK
jgi:hypothetical protein